MMTDFFKTTHYPDHVKIECNFCNRIIGAFDPSEVPQKLPICECTQSIANAAEMLKIRPATVTVH